MSAELDELAGKVAEEQKALEGQTKDTRKRVLAMGKHLNSAQKKQKKEQAKTHQTWEEWLAEQNSARPSFPNKRDCFKYQLIARYPGAYTPTMSIKEAYREAGKWKKNGGDPPPKEKLTIKARHLITIGAASAKLHKKIENLTGPNAEPLAELASEQEWTEDEILGAVDELILLKQGCNLLVRELRALQEQMA